MELTKNVSKNPFIAFFRYNPNTLYKSYESLPYAYKLLFDFCYRPKRYHAMGEHSTLRKSSKEFKDYINSNYSAIESAAEANRGLELQALKRFYFRSRIQHVNTFLMLTVVPLCVVLLVLKKIPKPIALCGIASPAVGAFVSLTYNTLSAKPLMQIIQERHSDYIPSYEKYGVGSIYFPRF